MCVSRITFTGLIIFLVVVAAEKSDILSSMTRNGWISSDYFATVLKMSFGASKCCNVLIPGGAAEIETLFNEFVRMYPFGYTLNNEIYDCDSYFLISTSVDKLLAAIEKVPAKKATSKLLIIVINNVEEFTGIFNVSMYENANVNIFAHNGLWKLSENFLEPRFFRQLSSPHNLEQKQGLVNLQGRELQAMAYWIPPFCYLESTINRTVNGIKGEYFTATTKSELDGVEVKLFMLIAEQLNSTWTIRNPKKNDRFGYQDGMKWTGGMLGQVIEKRADIVFSSMWLTLDKYQFSNTTQPWTTISIHFLVPRPRPYNSFWALTRPLSPIVWCALLAILILQSSYVYTRAWITPNIQKHFRSFTITWTELLGRLVGSWAPSRMRGFKLQFQLWHVFGILLVTAYSSSLAARLTNAHYEKRIDTLQDFVAANLSWGWKDEVPSFSKIFDYSDPYAEQVIARYNKEITDDDKHREIMKRNFAVLGNIVGSTFYPRSLIGSEAITDLRVMKTPLAQFQTTFVVQPWLLQSVDTVMLRMQDAGLVQYHLNDVLHRRTGSILREVVIEHDNYMKGPRVLGLNPLGAAFVMLAIGLSISTAVFLLELRSARRN